MTTQLRKVTDYSDESVPNADVFRFGIVVSEWHSEITKKLYEGAFFTLQKYGANEENIITKYVPGSFELPFAAKLLSDFGNVDAVICIGCIIKGKTPHFEYIARAVSQGIMKVGLDSEIPVIFCVLTTNTIEQAKERSGGKYGNKGVEAAISAIKMAYLHDEMLADEDNYFSDDFTDDLDDDLDDDDHFKY